MISSEKGSLPLGEISHPRRVKNLPLKNAVTTITLPGGTSLPREEISLPFEKSSLPVKITSLLTRGKILLSTEQKMYLPGGKYLQ